MGQPLKVAVVGAGISERHFAGFARLPELFEMAALCSLDVDRVAKLAAEHGVAHTTTSFDEVLAMDVDAVDICTPPNLHWEMATKALDAGKHVIIEKPLFLSLAEVDAMAARLETDDRRLMPIFQYRFGHALQQLKHLVDSGIAGRHYLSTVETHWERGPAYYAVPWRVTWAGEGGGCLLGHAIHAHDMLTHIVGAPTQIYARTATLVNDIEVEDTAAATLDFADGSLATLSATLGSCGEISRLRFCFEHLTAESHTRPYTPSRAPWTFTGRTPEVQAEIDAALDAVATVGPGYARQFELFHAALTESAPLPVTIADARQSLELVTAAYASAASGQAETLPIGPGHPLYGAWAPTDA